jgi:BirA family biotin operon repressor/biotin-[acetyl-CoA-carboxylase] ligase
VPDPLASSWTDLDRPPLSAARLQRVVDGSALWREIRVVDVTASTNADVAAAAALGAAEGLVIIAEEQRAGRGRLDRRWESPARTGLLVSVLLRPDVPASALPLLPLLVGLAAVESVRAVAGVPVGLKWPNDVLAGGRKLGGVLAERLGGVGSASGVVVGIGLNVSTRAEELPLPTATSIHLEGGVIDREPLAKELLRALERRYAAFRSSGGSPVSVLPAYRQVCETIGQRVEVQLPEGGAVMGTAVNVNDSGMLVVRDDAGRETARSAGDVVHLRQEG